jgi:hypothetical protein
MMPWDQRSGPLPLLSPTQIYKNRRGTSRPSSPHQKTYDWWRRDIITSPTTSLSLVPWSPFASITHPSIHQYVSIISDYLEFKDGEHNYFPFFSFPTTFLHKLLVHTFVATLPQGYVGNIPLSKVPLQQSPTSQVHLIPDYLVTIHISYIYCTL